MNCEALPGIPSQSPLNVAAAKPVQAVVALGGNLGDAARSLYAAMQAMRSLPGVYHVQGSHLYKSAPVDSSGPDYVNAVALLQTTLSPAALLKALQAIEQASGRTRPYRNAPRTLDLDLIFHGDVLSNDPVLTLPHPRWDARAFVLLPLQELCPSRVTPQQLAAVAAQRIERMAQRLQ